MGHRSPERPSPSLWEHTSSFGRNLRPIKTSNLYLGPRSQVKIGYQSFEKSSVTYRLSQSWVAFRRLHVFLKRNKIPLGKRLALWRACVWSITRHGLLSVGLDSASAAQLVSQTARQVRTVARSPAHIRNYVAAVCWTGRAESTASFGGHVCQTHRLVPPLGRPSAVSKGASVVVSGSPKLPSGR